MRKEINTYAFQRNAEKYGMKVNPDTNHVLKITGKLRQMHEEYGDPYCPCLAGRKQSYICPCKYMREKQICRCGLYVKEIK